MSGEPGATDDVRRAVAVALALVAAVLLFVGGLTLYARTAIFSQDKFADRTVESLKDPRVRTYVSDRIVATIIEQGSTDLITAKPLLQTVVSGALAAGPLRTVVRAAAIGAYRLAFVRDRSSVVLDLADAGVVVVSAMRAVAPQIGRKIPRNVEPGLIKLTNRTFTVSLIDRAEQVRFLGIVLPILALLCFAGTIALATDRRDAITGCGIGITVVAVLWVVAYYVGRSIVGGSVEPAARGAVSGVWEAFFGDFRLIAFGVGAAGIAVAASASSILQPYDAERPAERAWAQITRVPRRPWLRTLRALALLAVSVFVVLRPQDALQVAAVTVGAAGVFFATSEVLRAVTRPRRREVEQARQDAEEGRPWWKPHWRGVWPIATFGVVAAIAVAVVLIAGDGRDSARAPRAVPISACNGYAVLCGRRLTQVAFAGSHNAMSAADEPGWYRAEHFGGITRQLDYGIRAFLIDTHYGFRSRRGISTDLKREGANRALAVQQIGEPAVEAAERLFGRLSGDHDGPSHPYLCHVLCELGATELGVALRGVQRFMATHPNEVVILFIEDLVSPADTAAAFERSGLLKYASRLGRFDEPPTLRSMIASNQRLFVMAEKDNGDGRYPWYHDGFDFTQDTPYGFKNAAALAGRASCDPNRGTPNSPLFGINHWIEAAAPSPKAGGIVNAFPFLLARARRCQAARRLLPNIVAVDFYDRGDVLGVVNVLNGIPRRARPSVAEVAP